MSSYYSCCFKKLGTVDCPSVPDLQLKFCTGLKPRPECGPYPCLSDLAWPDLTEPTVPDIAKFETQPETEAIFFYFQQQNYI